MEETSDLPPKRKNEFDFKAQTAGTANMLIGHMLIDIERNFQAFTDFKTVRSDTNTHKLRIDSGESRVYDIDYIPHDKNRDGDKREILKIKNYENNIIVTLSPDQENPEISAVRFEKINGQTDETTTPLDKSDAAYWAHFFEGKLRNMKDGFSITKSSE